MAPKTAARKTLHYLFLINRVGPSQHKDFTS
jgi:hypothetical protein